MLGNTVTDLQKRDLVVNTSELYSETIFVRGETMSEETKMLQVDIKVCFEEFKVITPVIDLTKTQYSLQELIGDSNYT